MAEGHNSHHIVPIPVYFRTLIALLTLMALTVYTGIFVKVPDLVLGSLVIKGTVFNNVIAMTIAVTKAMLVIQIFMGVRHATSLVKLWAMTGFVWFSLVFIILADYGTRRYEPVMSWNKDIGSSLPRRLEDSRQKARFYNDVQASGEH